MPNESSDPVVQNVNRYETTCCKYLFNLPASGKPLLEDAPFTGEVHGRGIYIIGECPGCRKLNPKLTKITTDNKN